MFRPKAILAIVLALALAVPVHALGVPLSTAKSVVFVDGSNGYMSGSLTDAKGFISRTSDGGDTWTAKAIDDNSVFGVDSVDVTRAWGVAFFSDYPWRSLNGGSSWSGVSGSLRGLVGNPEPSDIAAISDTVALVAGSTSSAGDNGRLATIWRTADGGASWATTVYGPVYPPRDDEQAETPATDAEVRALSAAPSRSVVYAAFNERTPSPLPSPTNGISYPRRLIYKSVNGGSTWTTHAVTASYDLADIKAVSDTVAWAVGSAGSTSQVLRTTNGSTWTSTTTPSIQGAEGISASSSDHAIVVGSAGKVARTTNGGSTWSYWQISAISDRRDLRSVAIVDSNRAIAVGDDQVVVELDLKSDGTLGGAYSFAVNGNLGSSVDKTAPTITVGGAANGATYTAAVTPTFSASDAGGLALGQPTATLDGKSFTSGTAVSAAGKHVLVVSAKDTAGNTATKTVTFYVKRTTKITFSAPSISSYASAKLSGRLTDSAGNPLRYKSVALQQSVGGVWKTFATTKTYWGGDFSYTAKPTTKTSYRAVFAGEDAYVGATSGYKAVLPKVYLPKPKAPKTMTRGVKTKVYGYLKPRHKKGSYPVKLKAYRYEGGKWVYKKGFWAKATNYNSTTTKYYKYVTLPYKGKWRIRAYHPKDSKNAKTYSTYDYVTVK